MNTASNSRIEALSWWVNLNEEQKHGYIAKFNTLRPTWSLLMIDKSSSAIESIYLNYKKDEYINNHPIVVKWSDHLHKMKIKWTDYTTENRPQEFINELTLAILQCEDFIADLKNILGKE